MELILLEKVQKLGDLGDKVNVKPGYGRNYLVPPARQYRATPEISPNSKPVAKNSRKRRWQEAVYRRRARDALEGFEIVLAANASEEGKLYGSIGPREIADAVTAPGSSLRNPKSSWAKAQSAILVSMKCWFTCTRT